MSRRVSVFLAVLALAATLGVTAGATTGKAAHPGVQIGVGEAAHRIELLRPRGATGNGQPDSKNPFTTIGALIQAAIPQNGIQYHGGPVVKGEKVVAIYWASSPVYTGGPQAGTTGAGSQDGSLVGYFLRNLGGSSYYNINTTYTDGSGNPIPNSLSYTGYWANNSSVPANCQNVSDTSIQNMIKSGFTSGKLTYDASTVYAVFSAGTVNLGGNFGNCNGTQFQYCAYHGSFSYNGSAVLYAAMPYNNAYPGSCTSFAAGGPPNGDAGADAEVNTLAHELEEANTDPQLNAWYDNSGYENADKCAWNFGTVNLNNNTANITVGAKNFLVQQNWLNLNGGSCAKTYGAAPATGTLSGTVTSSVGGGAVSGATVAISGGGSTTTASNGTYTISNVTPGTTISVTASKAGFTSATVNNVTVTAGGTTTQNFSLTPTTGAISGKVVSAASGNPAISGATVAITAGGSGSATTASDGTYTIANVTPGTTISVTASATGFASATVNNVTVTAGVTTANVNFTLTPTTSVPGAPSLSAATNPRSCFFGFFCSGGGVKLTWTVPASNGSSITGYRIFRSTTSTVSTSGSPYATASSSATTYTDSSTTSGATYWYKVVAVNGVGPGPDSNVASAKAG